MNRFAIIPYDLYEDLANGEITLSMFQAMILLHKWADWETGVVRKVRASRMEQASGEHGPAARTFQRALKNLHDSGRITSCHIPGSRSWYKIAINNFTALSGALKDTVLRPTELTDWRVLDEVRGAERGGEDGCEDACEEGREEATVLKSSQKSIQKSSQQSRQKSETTLSLSNSLVRSAEKSAERDNSRVMKETDEGTEIEVWFYDLQGNADEPTAAARGAAATISEELLGQKYTQEHEKTILPEMMKLFSNGTPPQVLFNKIYFFMEWVIAKGLASRFTSMKDFFFHWNNESGRENGFRAQFEAECRAASKDVSMKDVRKTLRKYAAPMIKVEDIEVTSL